MKLGIIAAMPQELDSLIRQLDQAGKQTRYGYIFHTGSLGRHEVILVQSGIGKVMSALAVGLLVNLFEVDAVINTGTAGALDPSLKVGDVVAAQRLAYHDVDLTAFHYEKGQMAGQPLYFESSPYFLSELKKVAPDVQVGLITSSDSFISAPDKKVQIRKDYPDCLAVEMEGAAVGQAARSLRKPFLVIRSISDTAEADAGVLFDEFLVTAGERSAQILLHLLTVMI